MWKMEVLFQDRHVLTYLLPDKKAVLEREKIYDQIGIVNYSYQILGDGK